MSTGLGRVQAPLGSEIKPIQSNPNPDANSSEEEENQNQNQTVTTSTITTSTSTSTPQSDGTSLRSSDQSTTRFTHLGARGVQSTLSKDGSVNLKPLQQSSSSNPSSSSTSSGKGNGKKKRKIRTLVSFQARESHFDRFNSASQKDQFRGFYTLFWIGLFLTMLNTFQTSFNSTGQVISLTFATLFSKDAGVLAISDGILVASTFICVLFGKLLKTGWLRYWPTLIWFQHFWQAALLAAVVKWTRYREWPWVQSGFFVLHTLSMMMKIHSYMAVNGNMADIYHKMKRQEKMLEERICEIYQIEESDDLTELGRAWEKAVLESKENEKKNSVGESETELEAEAEAEAEAGAEAREAEGEGEEGEGDSSNQEIQSQNRVENRKKENWNSWENQKGTSSLRQRFNSSKKIREENDPSSLSTSNSKSKSDAHDHKNNNNNNNNQDSNSNSKSNSKSSNSQPQPSFHLIRDPHPLTHHPDALVSSISRDIEHDREELISNGNSSTKQNNRVMWPENITYWNFWDYLLVPTLCYELEYPRTDSIRPLYVLEKTLATFGTFFVIYVITEHWIMPHQPSPSTPLITTFLQLALPMMINYLLIFYIMFECICNAFAELTRFADREFYQDWWNATSMDVFSRRWNKPVHSFLLKHVYASSIAGWGINRKLAMFLTFLLSSLLHELVMAIVSGKVRGYLFAMQMAQLPLIVLGQIPFIKRNEALGNFIFWIGLMMGFPLLNIGYLVY